MNSINGWDTPQKILVILAHPDDPEFFCGGTIAKWTEAGHSIRYCLLTRGNKGANDPDLKPSILAKIREREQLAAARVLGVEKVIFLCYEDGEIIADLPTRREVTRVIRQEKPDILVSCDPTNYFPREVRLNHPDHRNAGQIVVDAVYPGAGNPFYFPELIDDGLLPHSVKELWLSVTSQPNIILDVTEYWERKTQALHEHVSQIGDIIEFDKKMYGRHTASSTLESPQYEEAFRRFIF
jgi:LmbE family N-acetylglucosaminyl deacetylase